MIASNAGFPGRESRPGPPEAYEVPTRGGADVLPAGGRASVPEGDRAKRSRNGSRPERENVDQDHHQISESVAGRGDW